MSIYKRGKEKLENTVCVCVCKERRVKGTGPIVMCNDDIAPSHFSSSDACSEGRASILYVISPADALLLSFKFCSSRSAEVESRMNIPPAVCVFPLLVGKWNE